MNEILRPFVLRREKKDVASQLGEKEEKELLCPLSGLQRRMYARIRRQLTAGDVLSAGTEEQLNNVLMQLRKVANHPRLFGGESVRVPPSLETGARLLVREYARAVRSDKEADEALVEYPGSLGRQTDSVSEPAESAEGPGRGAGGLRAFHQRAQLRELADVVEAFAELEDETKPVLARAAQLRARVGLRSGFEFEIPGLVMEMVEGLGRGERALRFSLGESVLGELRK